MSDINTVKAQIQSLIDLANTTTGNTDTNLTDGVNALVSGFGQGGSGSDLPIAEKSSFGGNATSGSKFYYNGVLLPEIPSNVLAEYPYCFIAKNTSNGYYDLFLSPNRFYLLDTGSMSGEGITKPWYRIEISTSESATEWIFNKDSTSNLSFTSRTVLWSSHDIYRATGSVPSLYFEATDIVPEVDDNTWYQIKASTMTDFSDEANRINGSSTPLTPSMMLEIFKNGNLKGNGYDVTFYDVDNKAIAIYSTRKGYSIIEPPSYPVTIWQDSYSNIVTFPYTPTTNVELYANALTKAGVLYEHFGVNIVEEPILIIGVVAYAGLNFTDVTIYFTDKIEDWGSTMVAMTNGYYSQYVRIDGTELLYTDEDIVTKLLQTLTNLVPNLTYNTVAKGVSYAESVNKTALTNLDVDIEGVITIE